MRRRHCLAGILGLLTGSLAGPALGREGRRPVARRGRRVQAATPAAPAASANAIPNIDGPPPPSRTPGLEPAPVPSRNLSLPPSDNMPRPSVALGIPTPAPIQQGQSFFEGDPSPDRRPTTSGLRLPSPGATLRLPF